MGYWKLLDTASVEKDFEDDYNVIVQNAFGVGTPPHSNIIQPFAISDGGVFQRTIIQPRVFTLQCATKTTTLDAWHTARKDLFAQLNRDRVSPVAPVTIRYDDGTTTLDIEAYYDGGLEIGTLEKTIEKFALRFVCPDPMWKASSTSSTSLNVRSTITGSNVVYRDSDGLWNSVSPSNVVEDNVKFAEKTNGNIILGGLDNDVYEWNGSTFTSIGTLNGGLRNVWGVAIDSEDNVIVVGDFTDIDAVTTRNIAKYNGTVWSEPATNGFNNIVYDVQIDNNGNYVCCGSFTTDALGGGTYRRAALVTASSGAIAEIGNGFDAACNAAIVDGDNNYYFVGDFQQDGPASVTLARFAKYDGSTMSNVDMGTDADTDSIVYDPNRKIVYIGGAFTASAPALGTKTLSKVAKSVNDVTFDMNVTDTVGHKELSLDNNGILHVLSSSSNTYLQAYRSGRLVREDIKGANSDYPETVFVDSSDNVWLCSATSVSSPDWVMAGRTTVNNTGLAPAYPTITITGPGEVNILRNYTTGKTIYFSGLTLQTSEVLTIDLSLGVKSVTSSLRGDVIDKVLRTSDLSTFSLIPGNNKISLWVDDATATASIAWTATYWSIDGVT